MMTPEAPIKVSVIIPTYNRGWILQEAIDSVLNQEYDPFELIVINDGSTDNTEQILDTYAGQIRTVYQENRGVSTARNRGIEMSTGSHIAFLDSDDIWLPQKLSQQVAFFDRCPEAFICQTEEFWVRDGVRVNPGRRHHKRSGMIFEASLHLCLVSPSAVMMRKALFQHVGLFDESLPACEDYDLWLRTSLDFPIYLVDTPLIVKRGGHTDQLSRQPSLDKYRIQSLMNLLNSGRLSDAQSKAAIEVLLSKCRIYANGCQKRERYQESQYYLDVIATYLQQR